MGKKKKDGRSREELLGLGKEEWEGRKERGGKKGRQAGGWRQAVSSPSPTQGRSKEANSKARPR